MADALEVDKVPDFLQDIQLDIEETVYINGIPEKEYYSMTVDVSDDAGKNDEEEKEEAFEFLSEKEAGQFVNIGAGLVLGDQKENKEEEKKEAKKTKAKKDLVDQALVIDVDGGERDQYETFGWLGRLKSSLVSKGAKVDIKKRDGGRDNEKEVLDKVNEEQQKVKEGQQPEEKKEEDKKTEEKKEEEKKAEEKKEEVPAMLLDHAPEDEDVAEELLLFVRKKDVEPFTFAVSDGPDRKAALKEEPHFPMDLERPVIELHASISNTNLTDFVSMYEAKQSELITNRKITKYVPVFGYSYLVFRYSCFDAAQNKYMRYHLALGFAMNDSIKQIVEKGLNPKGDYKGSLQSAEGLPSDMSKAYRTSYTKLDDVLLLAVNYARSKYRLLDRNANSFVRDIAEEAGLAEADILPDENQSKPMDINGLIFENMGTVVGRENNEGGKKEKEEGKDQENEQQKPEEELKEKKRPAGVGDLSTKMMKGFGTVTKGHDLPIDMLRMIAGVERLGEVEPEDEFILEGLPDVGVPQRGFLEEEPKRGNEDLELIELEEQEPDLKLRKKLDDLEEHIFNLEELEIIPVKKEPQKKEPQKKEPPKVNEILDLDKLGKEIHEEAKAKKKTGRRKI